MRRLLPQPLLSLLLLVVWLLANNSIEPGVVLLGAVLALGIPLLTQPFWPERPRVVRFGPLFRLVGIVLFDIVIANLTVARLILGPTSRLRPRFLIIPLALESPFSVTILASIISLTPGTVSANLSGDRRTLLVHGLDVGEPVAAVARIKTRYERRLLEVFGC